MHNKKSTLLGVALILVCSVWAIILTLSSVEIGVLEPNGGENTEALTAGDSTLTAQTDGSVADMTRRTLVSGGAQDAGMQGASTFVTFRIVDLGTVKLGDQECVPIEVVEFDQGGVLAKWSEVIGVSRILDAVKLHADTTAIELRLAGGAYYGASRKQCLVQPGQDNKIDIELVPTPILTVQARSANAPLSGCTISLIGVDDSRRAKVWSGKCDQYGSLDIPWKWSGRALEVVPKMEGFCAVGRYPVSAGYAGVKDESILELLMLPEGSLEILAVDESGNQARDCSLTLRWSGNAGGIVPMGQDSVVMSVRTDSAGKAVVSPVPSGALFELEAEEGSGYRGSLHYIGDSGKYYQMVRLVLERHHHGSLLVTDQDGNPVKGARVGLGEKVLGSTNVDGSLTPRWPVDSTESASIAWVQAEGFAFYYLRASEMVAKERIYLEHTKSLSGEIVRNGIGVPHASVAIEFHSPGGGDAGRILGKLSGIKGRVAESDEEGKFTISGLPSSDVDLSVRVGNGIPFSVGRFTPGEEDVRIELPDQSSRPLVHVTVLGKGSRLPIKGAEVAILLGDSGGYAVGASKWSNKAGQLDFELEREGLYSLSVSAPGKISFRQSEFDVRAGEQSIVVELESPGSFRLAVSGGQGQVAHPLAVRAFDVKGIQVPFSWQTKGGGESFGKYGFTDVTGVLYARKMPPGILQLELIDMSNKEIVGTGAVRVVEGECVDVAIAIE